MRPLKLIGLPVLLVLLTAAIAAAKASPPVAVVESPNYTFPATVEGADVSHDFVIRNTGGTPLIIQDVEAACGCITASFTKAIPPGGQGAITLTVSTRGYGGKTITQTAHAQTNDPANEVIDLAISCPVDRFVESVPSLVHFKGPAGTAMKQQVQIIPEEKYPFKIIGSRARDGQYIRYEIKEAPVAGRAGYIINVENTKTDVGTYQDSILLKTDNDIQPLLNLRVYGEILDPSRQPQDASKQPGGK